MEKVFAIEIDDVYFESEGYTISTDWWDDGTGRCENTLDPHLCIETPDGISIMIRIEPPKDGLLGVLRINVNL